jgi:3-phenylpropionate/trans-cinnamate dioxygenase ferredoxin subunit
VEVARTADLGPEGRRLVDVEGVSIGLFQVDGAVVAVRNVCPHAFGPVCLGRVGGTTLPSPPGEFRWGREGEILACPWHGWEFELRGGACLSDRRRHLRTYPVHVDGDRILLEI